MKVDLSPYIGEWVAICDDRIVSHRSTFKKAFEEAKRLCPETRPLLSKVPTGAVMIL